MGAVELDGAFNVRDVGGLSMLGGGRIRPGLLYRGDSLDAISAPDQDLLFGHLRIGVVVDVRTTAEISFAPWRESRVRYCQIPLVDARSLGTQPMAAATAGQLAGMYLSDLRHGAQALARILTVLADHLGADVPCLVHCAAGRDRTGAIMAVLLAAAGVRDEDIAGDYVQSNHHVHHVTARLAANPLYANGLTASHQPVPAQPETVTLLLAAVRREYGTVARFLLDCGLRPDALEHLTAALADGPRDAPAG
ncbi:MAG: tyrosine-protein phosphatase [Streptosporangiaceae bacterium]